MKMIMSALAASVLLGGFAASASAETVSISSIMQEYAKAPSGEVGKYAKQRRIVAKEDEYIADKRETGTEGWWQQMDREQRGGRR